VYKNLLGRQRDNYEAVLIAYLHMNNKLDELQRAFEGKIQKFTLKEEFMPLQSTFNFPPAVDIVGPMGLSSIFDEGRFSNECTEYQPDMKVRASVRGFAEFLVRDNRIMVVQGQYFVRGVGGRVFHVSHFNQFIQQLTSKHLHTDECFNQIMVV